MQEIKQIQVFWLSPVLETSIKRSSALTSSVIFFQLFSFSEVSALPETEVGVIMDISIILKARNFGFRTDIKHK